jgi:4-hydroxy-4-methyl-2-oxoglutarate aldolase
MSINPRRLGEEDGVIVIPAALVVPVLERSEELTAVEQRIRVEVLGGLSLQKALKTFGHV